jgi:putative SOS response-associated peptidase YedK
MCYDIQVSSRRQVKAAKRGGVALDEVNRLIAEHNERFGDSPLPQLHWHVSGFEHPELPVIAVNTGVYRMEPMRWGLIPRWCKDMPTALKLWNQCLNARSETMAEKPSFRAAFANGRGVLVADSFFEHHHFAGKVYPFNIRRADGEPLLIATICDEWTDRDTGEVLHTFAIVTTEGNPMMTAIHNNPKLEGPRMPLILECDALDVWLNANLQGDTLREVCRPLDGGLLTACPVRPLRGKSAMGNDPMAVERYDYPELALNTDLAYIQ